MKINTFLVLFLWINSVLVAQTDTTKLLPSVEVMTQRLNVFSIGQTRLQSDSLTISLFQNQHLSDYLQATTPLSTRTYGTGLASVAVRGMAANHTAILWNGINLQNPLSGLNDMALLDVGATQRIDVKLGGNSALFGSGAIGGVIYLDNEKPKKDGFHAQLGFGLGSYGFKNGFGQFDFNKNKVAATVRIAHQAAENDFLYKNTAEVGQPLQRANHAAYSLLNITANVFAELTKRDFVKFNYWTSINFREITPTMTARSDNATYRDTANRMVGEWTHFFKNSYLKVRGAFVFDKNFYNSDVVNSSQNNIQSYVGEAEWNHDFSAKHTIRAGINTTSDVSNNINYLENHQRTRVALFVNDALTTNFVTITGNIRQEWLEKLQPTTFSIGFEKEMLKMLTQNPKPKTQNPKPKTQNSKLILRGSLSRNFNVPTFNDLYWAELGNPNLETEQGWSKELGLTFKNTKAAHFFQSHLTFFDIDMKNRIVWQPQSDGKWRPTNVNRIVSKGIEAWASFQVSKQAFQYKISVNYQFAHATDGEGGVQLFVPKQNGSVSAWLKYHKIYVAWQQTASSKRFGTTDKTTWTNAFTLADATLGFTPSVKSTKLDLRLMVSNVFNTDYQVIRYYSNPKSEYRLVLTLAF